MPLPELSDIHRRYLVLSRIAREDFAGNLGGKLLFRSGFDTAGAAVVLAGSIAGAASLCVDSDGTALRQGLRSGLCDFVVANLDEALRILKNEVRRGLPVCVSVTADPMDCIAAMIGRGVQPDLLSPESGGADPSGIFAERGALLLPDDDGVEPETSLLGWSVAADAARTMPQIGRIAAEVLDPSRTDTPARRRWLEQSSRYMGRTFGAHQCLRTSNAETVAFLNRVQSEVPGVNIQRNGVVV